MPLLARLLLVAALLVATLLAPALTHARPLFADDFEPPSIDPLFPVVAGQFQLPAGPTTDRLTWLLSELAAGQTTTEAEVLDNFDPSWLGSINVQQTIDFIASVRASYPNARVTDVVGVTPVRLTVVIDSPGSAPPSGFLNLGATYSGDRKIVLFGVSSYGGSVQFPADQNLTLPQAADKFATLSSAPALLVGRIDASHQCQVIEARDASTPRATASIFKTWVLAGLAQGIVDGPIDSSQLLPLIASEIAPGGTINSEPLGTQFPLRDLAILMMGISDNTATDLVHERVGRTLIGQTVIDSGHALPDLLLPFLNISEQFHLFLSFPLSEALDYINGSQAFRNQFLVDEIEPLGPNNGGPFFHVSLLTDGTWQASPLDICRAFAWLRQLPKGSEALAVVDAAFGAQAAQPDVRSDFDRVWYKGGSLASGSGLHVLTHAWLLEDAGEDPFVVIAMSNSSGGGIDQFAVQSVTGRMLELVDQLP